MPTTTYLFTPPVINDGSPTAEWDHMKKRGDPLAGMWSVPATNPTGYRLMQFYRTRPVGVAIYKMDDGTFRSDRPIPRGPVLQTAWPPVPITENGQGASQVNGAINQSWLYSRMVSEYVQDPGVVMVWYGGSTYPVSPADANALITAGFGDCITIKTDLTV